MEASGKANSTITSLVLNSRDKRFQPPPHAVRKVAFVGQPEYFRCLYENDLDSLYEVREFRLGWSKGLRHYHPLITFDPDVAFFFRPECYPPALLDVLGGIKVAISSEPIPKHIMGHYQASADMDGRFNSLLGAKNRYDFFFHYDKTSLRFLRERGFQVDGELLFPVATGLYRPIPYERRWDWGFFGRDTPHRESYLGVAKRDYEGLHVVHGIYGEEFVRLMNQCKIGLNVHVDGNLSLEHRMHNMMACGVMVMSEPLSHNDLLKPEVHYVEFSEREEFQEKLEYYLANDEEREAIAANGLQLMREHLSADKLFPRLIEYLTRADRREEPFYVSLPSREEPYSPDSPRPVSFVRLNSVLGGLHGVRDDALSRWRSWHDRRFPEGSLVRSAYRKMLRPIKRMLGDESMSLGETLRDRVRRARKLPASPGETLQGKSNLSHILETSVRRLNLPSDAPSVLILLPSQSISGGTMVVCEHANRLIRRGYNVLLVDNLLAGENRFHLNWFANLAPMVVPISRIYFDVFADAVMATHWTTAYTAIELPAYRHFYFVQSDETRFNSPGSVESIMARESYRMPFEFLTIAQWLQRWLEDQFGKTSRYIPNAVNEELFYPDAPLKPKGKKLRVLLEGPIDVPFKGMEDAFRAVQDLDCEVWCVSSLGKPKRGWHCDRFFHRVPFHQMRRVYSSCDVLLKMSRIEGFFLPPLEMMACGGTVVTGKVTGYDEYIVDGHNGLVVETGDVEAARGCLQSLIDDRSLLEALKGHGAETVAQWRWDRSNEALHQILIKRGVERDHSQTMFAHLKERTADATPRGSTAWRKVG